MNTQGNLSVTSSARAFSRTASVGLGLLGGLVLVGWALALPAVELMLVVTGGSILLLVLVWMNAATLARLDNERRHREEALQESEERYRNLFENASDAILSCTLDGTITAVNRGFEEMTGWSRQEVIGRDYRTITPAAFIALTEERTRRALAGERLPSTYEAGIIGKDGSMVAVEARTRFIYDQQRKPVGFQTTARDISERKRAEEALHESEQQYRSLIDIAQDVIFTVSRDGTFTSLNPAFETVTDWARAEWLEKSFVPFVHPADRARALGIFRQLLQGETPALSELRVLFKSGAVHTWEFTTAPQFREGAVESILVIARDTTARKQVEAALRDSEERFRLLSASSPIGIFSNNVAGACLYTNLRWQEIAGMTLEESLGEGWASAIAPADTEKVLTEWQACVGEGRKFSQEFRFRRPSGEIRWVRAQATALQSASSTPLGYVGTVEDITERRQVEAELEQLRHQQELILQSVADGIYVLDRQRRAIFANPAATRIVGYMPEELLGHSTHDLLHHSRPDGAPYPLEQCPIELTFADGTLRQVADEVFWRKDGSSFPVEYTSAPMREDGQITGVVVAFRDISERRVVERIKDEFVSVVSHELRTPLTSIRGALGLLTSGLVGALPDKGRRMLEIAVNNTDRLVRLINDILDIERMQSGKVLMQYRLCDAAALLGQASDEMRAMADKVEVTLTVQAQPLRLWADPDRLVQTLTNLLSNALKFSPPQTAVRLSVQRQGEEAVFTIRDQGRGIPADKLESIFERFQQVDASDSRQKGGTGLGLAICRSIVQQHGGRIWVESELGAGSTFSFTVPMWKEAEQPLEVPAGQPLVLACDDDPAVLEVVAAVLEQRGYQVVTTTTGQEAVVQAEAQQPALILLDLLMPQMNGWDTMAALKRKPETRNIPIIIFSILSPPETGPLPSACVGWVQKSLGETALCEALKRALDERAQVAQVLVVEDDLVLARVLIAMFERHGIKTVHAETVREAIAACERRMPDLVVLDLLLPDGDGVMVADWMRQRDQLRQVPLVVYSAKDLEGTERERLQSGHTEFFIKGRVTPEEFEHQLVAWLDRIILAKGASSPPYAVRSMVSS